MLLADEGMADKEIAQVLNSSVSTVERVRVEGFADGMRAYTREHAYQNFIDRSQADSAHAYYGDNLDRLVRIKRLHDPEDFFHFGHSVPQHHPGA